MAETPAATTEYERRRQENIVRNKAILAQLRRDAADVSALFATPARPKKQPRPTPPAPAGPPRRSGRTRLQPLLRSLPHASSPGPPTSPSPTCSSPRP